VTDPLLRCLEILRKSMLAAGAGMDAAQFTGGRALQPETGSRKRRKRKKRKKRDSEECIETQTIARAIAAWIRDGPPTKRISQVRLL
jgi:hypothetical protein